MLMLYWTAPAARRRRLGNCLLAPCTDRQRRRLVELEEAVGKGVLEVGDVLDELDRPAADEKVMVNHATNSNHGEAAVLELNKLNSRKNVMRTS
jgi:hypothetical protein